MSEQILTIGHSTHPLDQFLALLARHQVEALVDIRRFPGSRKFPHFNRDNLASALQDAGIEYHWLEALGGRRHKKKGSSSSPNLGLQNESFRNYADYMLTEEFRQGVDKLLEVAGCKRAAIMCAEGLYWRCHRRLVSDFLSANGITAQHIMPSGEVKPHQLIEGARVAEGKSLTQERLRFSAERFIEIEAAIPTHTSPSVTATEPCVQTPRSRTDPKQEDRAE